MPLFRRKPRDWRRNKVAEPNIWRQIAWGVFSIVIVILVVAAIWYLTRLSGVTIVDVAVRGGETISHEVVRSKIKDELKGTYWRVIPYTFSYLYPHDRIVDVISATPRIHDVIVERTSRTKLAVSFEEYLPAGLWCMTTDENADCYFLDERGFAFSPAPPLRGGTLTRHVIEGKTAFKEEQILTPELFAMTKEFAERLATELNLRVTNITHSTEGDSTYHINGGGDLFVTTEINIEETLKNLRAILESKEFNHLEPGNFRYIDLRFGGKIFVNEELEPVSTTTEDVASST